MALLQKTLFRIWSDHDFVKFKIDDRELVIPYKDAIHIAGHMQVAAGAAFQKAGAPGKTRFEYNADDVGFYSEPLIKGMIRYSGLRPNFNFWKISTVGAYVRLGFDNLVVDVSPDDASYLSDKMRRAARNAKAWAGDGGKRIRVFANLTNAEDNYKIGAK